MHNRSIFWFKRDLRIYDNKAFFDACFNSKEIIPIFIFIPELLEKFKSYDKRLGFLIESLSLLEDELRSKGGMLYCFIGEPEKIFAELINKYHPNAVYTNKSCSFLGARIEEKIIELCKKYGIEFKAYQGNFLGKIDEIPYKKVFSHFFREWKKHLDLTITPAPKKVKTPVFPEPTIGKLKSELKYEPNPYWKPDFGFKRLKEFNYKDYEKMRNRVDQDGTSKLSPYIRFGLISLKELYNRATEVTGGDNNQFVKELAWREFWYHIKFYFPELKWLEFQEKRRHIPWENDEKLIEAFFEGKTGYPIVDAAIRQLKEEGWIHNRLRMILASFLTKDILTDWRIGEAFFKYYLIDYDEIVNTGNWQWVASVGPDPRPLRIFNPILQSQKYDPEGIFIKKYIPELKNVETFKLHNPIRHEIPYYRPIVNHYERVKYVKEAYFRNKKSSKQPPDPSIE